jgi:Chaperone of endosialidase
LCRRRRGAVLGTCSSDARLKKNIQPFSPVLDKLVQLQPVSYNWRVEEFPQFHFGTSRTSGLIAQEVEKVFPEMVSVDKDGFKRVNYSELPYLMLQAIRDLKAEKDKLQEEMKAREAQWEERFRAQEERASLQEVQQQVAALEARLARVEVRGGSNQASAATREAPKRNTAAVD